MPQTVPNNPIKGAVEPTVAKKVNTGKKMDLPGIMFWQLAGDLPVDSENSLLRVISTELGYKKDGSR